MTYLLAILVAIAYFATLLAFVVVDLIWLGLVARKFYRSQLAGLMAEKICFPAAIAFYLLYPAGIVVFAVTPWLASGTWQGAATLGALFGFFAYATYDLTNLATLRNWPVALTLVDLLWGTALTALAAICGHLAVRGF